ncbi:hypothetical protein [Prosthecobacter sp.]|uniref:hypothetical protein n=1 Tax=Prosthecobacter sp. TaxID=1965333 RepID=UPI003783D9E4
MDTPSPKPKSWEQLAQQARSAGAPADIDMRAAVRAEISSPKTQVPAASLLDDVLSLCRSGWLRTGFAVLALMAALACRESFEAVNELSWIWQIQGPVLADI